MNMNDKIFCMLLNLNLTAHLLQDPHSMIMCNLQLLYSKTAPKLAFTCPLFIYYKFFFRGTLRTKSILFKHIDFFFYSISRTLSFKF